MIEADVIVVGGGPGGSAAALALAREGYGVALFDRATFPRDKVCGEFVNPAALKILERELGLPRELFGGAEVHDLRLDFAKDRSVRVPLLDEEGRAVSGFVARRLGFDETLLSAVKAAGVAVFENCNVRSVKGENGWQIVSGSTGDEPFTARSKLVVAADGSHSVIARQLGLTRPTPRLAKVGYAVHFKGIPETDADSTWMFPSLGDGNTMGFSGQGDGSAVMSGVVPKSLAGRLAQNADSFIEQQIAMRPLLADHLKGAERDGSVKTVGCFGHKLSRPYAPGILFVGDATRFVDPFTGEGIHHALESGVLAARTASLSLQSGDFSVEFLSRYGRDRRSLELRYLLCDIVQAVVARPWLMKQVGQRLERNPILSKTLIGAIVDILPAWDALRPSFVMRLLLA